MASRKRRVPLMENIDPIISEEPTLVDSTFTEETIIETPETVNDFVQPLVVEEPQELEQPVQVTPRAVKPRKVIFPKKDNSSHKSRNVPRFS